MTNIKANNATTVAAASSKKKKRCRRSAASNKKSKARFQKKKEEKKRQKLLQAKSADLEREKIEESYEATIADLYKQEVKLKRIITQMKEKNLALEDSLRSACGICGPCPHPTPHSSGPHIIVLPDTPKDFKYQRKRNP